MTRSQTSCVFQPSCSIRSRGRAYALFVVASALAHPSRSSAQETPHEEFTVKRHPERVLADHTFLSPTLFPAAFIGTSFALRQGFIAAEIPDYPVSGSGVADVSLLGQAEQIEASLRFLDRFEVFLNAGGQALIGSSVRSAVAGGGSFSYTVGGGGQMRLYRQGLHGTEISVRAHGAYGPGGLLDLLQLVDAVIEQDPETVQAVVDRQDLRKYVLRNTARAQGDVQVLLAQRLSPAFGVQAALGAAYSWSTIEFVDSQSNDTVDVHTRSFDPEADVAIGANLDPHVPLGFLLEYSLRLGRRPLPGSENVDRSLSHVLALGVQIVHPQFQVGLTTARSFGIEPIERADANGMRRQSDTPYFHSIQLGLEFTWW